MRIELFDLDVPYELGIDVNDKGDNFIRIKPNSTIEDRDEDYDICLDKRLCEELIETLEFLRERL